jgi:hypothetical protein
MFAPTAKAYIVEIESIGRRIIHYALADKFHYLI